MFLRDGAMNAPTRPMLALFTAAVRMMDAETLETLRVLFVEFGEHPATIAAIDREMKTRARGRRTVCATAGRVKILETERR